MTRFVPAGATDANDHDANDTIYVTVHTIPRPTPDEIHAIVEQLHRGANVTKHKDEPEHNPIAAIDPPQVEDTGNPTPLSPPEDIEHDQHTEPKAKPKTK